MFIGYFTERPYQDPQSGFFGATGAPIKDLTLSNDTYNPRSALICTTAIWTRRSTPKRWGSMALC